MIPTVTVDARSALAQFSRAGIPESVRNSLRQVIPDLTKRLGALAQDNLIGGVDSWTHIDIKKEMVENPSKIIGRVRSVWTGDSAKKMVPQWIEEGTRAHEIWASGAHGGPGPKNLFFFWKKIGTYWGGPMVHNPGVTPRHYMKYAFEAMHDEIIDSMTKAVTRGTRMES